MTQQLIDLESSILDILSPFKSININSSLHSFYKFKELKSSVEFLLKAQSNLIFYVLHQNFMCDEKHKVFFKNMVGKFYDLPEKYWDYYRGSYFINVNEQKTIAGLVLLENAFLFKSYLNGEIDFFNHLFAAKSHEKQKDKLWNQYALEEHQGLSDYKRSNVVSYSPWSATNSSNKLYPFESGRFNTNWEFISPLSMGNRLNYWFKTDYHYVENSRSIEKDIKNIALYASIGLEKKDEIIQAFRDRAVERGEVFKEEWVPIFDSEKEKLIRSLSQTFPWTKEYIFENIDLLNLDVLGLNMSVPWDMDLVKFFISKGYGGRMSENKAVYDKVFEPILTEEILDKLFRCEYEKY